MENSGNFTPSAAFKRLVMELPQIGFVKGHGERECIKSGDRDYSIFAQERTFRYSLINQGFDYTEVALDKEVPASVDILVLADVRNALTEVEQTNLNNFIARGGNLLIAGEPDRQEIMNPLVAQFGVSFMPGRLVKPSENFSPDFIVSIPTKEGADMMYLLGDMRKEDYVATMPGTSGIQFSTDKGFKVTTLFTSDTAGGTWSEVETKDFVNEPVSQNISKGEDTLASIPTAVALNRKVGDKDQRIVILGDADCISNGEISIGRKDVSAANYYLIMGAFYWMSNEEVPIDVRRPTPPDNTMSVGMPGVTLIRWLFIGLIPLAMIIFYVLMWIRRKGR
jgi:ABC-2 type transport system permease protein